MSDTITTARGALARARGHAGATLHSLGEAVEEFAQSAAHTAAEAADRAAATLEEKLPELAGRAGELVGKAEAVAGIAASNAGSAAGVALERLDEGVHTARKELASRIEPAPRGSSAKWWWLGAGVLAAVGGALAWWVLSRRPQAVEPSHVDAPIAEPPAAVDVDVDVVDPAPASRNGQH